METDAAEVLRIRLIQYAAAVWVLSFSSCALVLHGTTQDVVMTSTPEGAKVTCGASRIGKTPLRTKFERGQKIYKLRFEKEGYAPADHDLGWRLEWVPFVADCCLGFPIAHFIDMGTRACYAYPGRVHVTLQTWRQRERDLVAALQDPAAQVRLRAVVEFAQKVGAGQLSGQAAIPHLIRALGDADLEVREGAAFALGRIGRPAVPSLIQALTSEKKAARGYAALALAEAGPVARDAIPALISSFPQVDEVLNLSYEDRWAPPGTPMMGGIINYRVLNDEALHVLPETPEAQRLKSKYGEYIQVELVSGKTRTFELWCAGTYQGIEKYTDLVVSYTLQAGPYALSRILGQNLVTREAWRKWWESQRWHVS